MTKPSLKIALVCQIPDALEPWMLRLAERICAAPETELCALIKTPAGPKPKTAFGPWWQLEAKYTARAKPADGLAFEAIRGNLPVIDAKDTDAIAALGTDVMIDLTPRQGQDCDPGVARFGVWHLDFLGPAIGAESVHAILSRDRLINITLMRSGAAPQPLATATLNTKFIAARNHLYLCEKAVTLILRELKRVHLTGALPEIQATAPAATKMPGLISFVRYGLHLARDTLTRVFEKIGARLKLRPGMFYLQTADGDPLSIDPSAMRQHAVPGNTYMADPFLWERDGETYCFFEVYDYPTRHGHLGAGKLVDGKLTDIRQIIRNDYHMSFPFLFEKEGELFMLPETCAADRIEVWKCVDFPYQWERHQIVLEGVMAADSSIVQIGEDWWLFTNVSTDAFGEMNSELHLYRIDGPDMSELTPHPLNPVVFDARTARNGGRVFEQDSVFYRASQNNSHGLYGYGINVMRIDHISMSEYRETLVRKIEPNFLPGLIGCHHVDTRGGRTIIDVRKRLGGRPKA